MVDTIRKPKTFLPQWEKIMDILGRPKQEAVYASRNIDPTTMDGSWDFQAMQRGVGMRRVSADIGKSNTEIETPTAFVFVCDCGYARRVVDSEHAFTCERPNAAGAPGCGIIWSVELEEGGEINPENGGVIRKPIYEERATPKTGRRYMMPKISGRYIADMRRETMEARKAAGQPLIEQPENYQPAAPQPRRVAEPPLVVPDVPEHPSAGGVQ